MTYFPVIPGAGVEAGQKVMVEADYDAFNQMQHADAEGNDWWEYRYDPLGRRIVEWNADNTEVFTATRFIHEGYSVIMERKFTHYYTEEDPPEVIYPSTDNAHSKPHKIFVRGSILFSAVDGDLDGYIGADEGSDQATVNLPEFDEAETESDEEAVGERFDFAYYYLDDARGRVMALLARDVETGVTPPYTEGGPENEEANLPRILEYYTYNAFGTVTALPVMDRAEASFPGVEATGGYHSTGVYPGSGSLGQWDRMEDTPLDLSDNAQLMYNRRNGEANHVASGESYGRESAFGNDVVGDGVRWMGEVGVQFQEAPRGGGDSDSPTTGTPAEKARKKEKEAKRKKDEAEEKYRKLAEEYKGLQDEEERKKKAEEVKKAEKEAEDADAEWGRAWREADQEEGVPRAEPGDVPAEEREPFEAPGLGNKIVSGANPMLVRGDKCRLTVYKEAMVRVRDGAIQPPTDLVGRNLNASCPSNGYLLMRVVHDDVGGVRRTWQCILCHGPCVGGEECRPKIVKTPSPRQAGKTDRIPSCECKTKAR